MPSTDDTVQAVSQDPAGQATRHPALAMLRGALVAGVVVGVNAAAVSAVAAGAKGLWGALLGLLIVIVFSGAGLLALHLSRRTSPTMQLAVAMASYTGRIAVFGGLLAVALNSDSLNTIANVASWALPFEALYQDALNRITADTAGFTKVALSLGPFGGAQPAGAWLYPYVVGYFAVLAAIGLWTFNRKDL